jgi:hypothetical protein
MTSAVFDVATILSALDQVDTQVGSTVSWRPGGPQQERLLGWRPRLAGDLQKIRHLDGRASSDANELNRFLAEGGFTFRFGPLAAPAFGAVSILRQATTWPEPAMSVPVFAQGRDHRGFILEGNRADGYHFEDGRTLVAMPSRFSDESYVWLLLGDELPDGSDGFELFEVAHDALARRQTGTRQRYASVTMPEVVLTATNALDWLRGLAGDGGVAIREAVQEARLRIDRAGGSEAAVASAAMAVTAAPAGLARNLVVDRPFIAFWTDDASPLLPLAVARCDFDTWSAWDSVRADEENAELAASDAAARKAAAAADEEEAPRRRGLMGRLFGRK